MALSAWDAPDFVAWVEAAFGHPVEEHSWYFELAFDEFWKPHDLPPAARVERLRQLFAEPAPLLDRYTHAQIAQALWFIAGESSPGELCHALLDPSVGIDARRECVRHIFTLFRDLLAPACAGPAQHHTDPLHAACYMWWDVFPSWGRARDDGPTIDAACLQVMEKTLELRVEVCQIAGLHGLNHWHLSHPAEAERIVDAFLRGDRAVSDEVRAYAGQARLGCCQ